MSACLKTGTHAAASNCVCTSAHSGQLDKVHTDDPLQVRAEPYCTVNALRCEPIEESDDTGDDSLATRLDACLDVSFPLVFGDLLFIVQTLPHWRQITG
jgi:hypothetical protein